MNEGSTMGERLARAEEWIEGHERRCEDRQVALGREIRTLKDGVGGLTKGAWGVVGAVVLQLIAVCAFLFAKLMHWS